MAHLSGQVTLGGKPQPETAQAFITFAPAVDPNQSVSVPITAGRYDSPKTPAGTCRVFFEITTSGPKKSATGPASPTATSSIWFPPGTPTAFHSRCRETTPTRTSILSNDLDPRFIHPIAYLFRGPNHEHAARQPLQQDGLYPC